MFVIQAYQGGCHLLGNDGTMFIRDLKTLRGLKRRLRDWYSFPNADTINIYRISESEVFRFDESRPIASFPVAGNNAVL